MAKKRDLRFFEIHPDVQNKIYAQFDLMFTIVPHYPEYCYLNVLMTNAWAGKLKRWQAKMVLESWKESRREIASLWSKSKLAKPPTRPLRTKAV